MIERGRHRAALERLIANNPVVGLVGARQVGKTTLAGDGAGRRSGYPRIAVKTGDAALAGAHAPIASIASR